MTLVVRQDCTGHGGKRREKMYPQLAALARIFDTSIAKLHGGEPSDQPRHMQQMLRAILAHCKTLSSAPGGTGGAIFQNNIMLTQQIADTVGLYPIFVFARAIALRYQLLNGMVAVNIHTNTLSG